MLGLLFGPLPCLAFKRSFGSAFVISVRMQLEELDFPPIFG